MKLIIFDLDGTLLNTIEDLGEAVNHALSLRNFPCHSMDEYYNMVGHGVRNLVKVALPEYLQTDESLVDSVLADFISWYTDHIDVHTRPYPGIPELLDRLKAEGYALAVASNKFQSGAEYLVKEFFSGIPFVVVLGNMEGAPLKPSPEIVFLSMAKAGIDRSQAEGNVVMVGDSGTDIATAANAGVASIAVPWGFRPADSLTAATYVATSVHDLEILIEKAISRP